MNDFLRQSAILIILAIPIAFLLIKVLFKNSIFGKIAAIWTTSVILTSINLTGRFMAPDVWTRGFSVPTTIIILTICVYISSRMLRDPLKAMMGDLSKMSKGDLNIMITNKYQNRNDEIGSLAMSINSISIGLNKILTNIKQNSES